MDLTKEARLTKAIAQFPNLAIAALATLLFALCKHGAHFSMLADDFVYAAQVVSNQFHLGSFAFFPRRPLSTLLSYFLYASRAPEFSQVQFYIAFFANAFALSTIVSYLRKPTAPTHFAIITVFCLYPSFHEVLFMNLTLSWALGAVYWALSLRTHNRFLQILGVACTAMSLETYIVPMLALPFLRGEKREIRSRTVTTLTGLAIYFVIKSTFGFFFEDISYALSFDPALIWEQIQNVFQFTWLIHFYKTYWFASALQLIAFALIAHQGRCNRALLALPFLTTLPMWLVAYYAPRSVHGSVLLNLALFASAALTLTSEKLQRTIIVLLLISYGSQLVVIANIKENNSHALKAHEIAIVERLKSCPSPCKIPLSDINTGFRGDWIMPELAYQAFIEWVARSHGFTQTLRVNQDARQ